MENRSDFLKKIHCAWAVLTQRTNSFVVKHSRFFALLCLLHFSFYVLFMIVSVDELNFGNSVNLLVFVSALCKVIIMLLISGLVLSLMKRPWMQKLFEGIILIPASLLMIVDAYLFFKFHRILDGSMLALVFATNRHEAGEFLEGNWLLFLFISFILVIIAAFMAYLMRRVLAWSLQHVRNFIVLPLLLSLTVFVADAAYVPAAMAVPATLYDQLGSIAIASYTQPQRLEYISSLMKERTITLTRNNSSIPYVVFVLGEATSRNHMSLYGYSLNTTPHLQQRLDQHDLYVFRDVVSSKALTMDSIERMFTFYRDGAGGHWYDYADLFSIVNKAGYHSYWLSNQERSGVYGFIGQLYADLCSEKHYTALRDSNNDKSLYDETVLPFIDEALKKPHEKNFFLIHLEGCHLKYGNRYPVEYNRFTQTDEAGQTDEIKQVRASYDNAVLYGDAVLDDIIKRFEHKNAIVIYVPDHGEDVYDSSHPFIGHGEPGTMAMIEIPMLIWTSHEFKNSYPELEHQLSSSLDKPFMTDDIIHVLLDVMRIETADYDASKSVLSSSYNGLRERLYDGTRYTRDWKKVK